LSDELRSLFELKGYDIVHTEVLEHKYEDHDKRLAAHAWLAQKRGEKEDRENWRFWIPVTIAVVALIVSLIALSK